MKQPIIVAYIDAQKYQTKRIYKQDLQAFVKACGENKCQFVGVVKE